MISVIESIDNITIVDENGDISLQLIIQDGVIINSTNERKLPDVNIKKSNSRKYGGT